MALAKTTLTCKTCGKSFDVRKQCHSRDEADNYEIWARDNINDCPVCRSKAQADKQADALAALLAEYSYTLPELTGISEKQVQLALDVRRKSLCDNLHNLRNALAIITQFNAAMADLETRKAFEAQCAEAKCTVEEALKENVIAYSGERVYTLITTTSANYLLNGRY